MKRRLHELMDKGIKGSPPTLDYFKHQVVFIAFQLQSFAKIFFFNVSHFQVFWNARPLWMECYIFSAPWYSGKPDPFSAFPKQEVCLCTARAICIWKICSLFQGEFSQFKIIINMTDVCLKHRNSWSSKYFKCLKIL